MYWLYRQFAISTIALLFSASLYFSPTQTVVAQTIRAQPLEAYYFSRHKTYAPGKILPEQRRPKNPDLALGLSISNTLLPILASQFLIKDDILSEDDDRARFWLSTYGIFLGPSTGYFYAGAMGHAFGGIGIRVLGAGVSFLGGALAVRSIFYETSRQENLLAAGLFYAGAGLILYKMISDIVKVRRTTVKLNEAKTSNNRFSLVPYISQKSPGLLLTYQL